ncbi:hypothetical protein V2G26_015388 [Clonostachys chloroleuca]
MIRSRARLFIVARYDIKITMVQNALLLSETSKVSHAPRQHRHGDLSQDLGADPWVAAVEPSAHSVAVLVVVFASSALDNSDAMTTRTGFHGLSSIPSAWKRFMATEPVGGFWLASSRLAKVPLSVPW